MEPVWGPYSSTGVSAWKHLDRAWRWTVFPLRAGVGGWRAARLPGEEASLLTLALILQGYRGGLPLEISVSCLWWRQTLVKGQPFPLSRRSLFGAAVLKGKPDLAPIMEEANTIY